MTTRREFLAGVAVAGLTAGRALPGCEPQGGPPPEAR